MASLAAGAARNALLAHLRRGSVAVKEGQAVRAGEPIARCGNSGNTSQPHLHLQVQSPTDFRATGLRTYPIVFRGARLARGHRASTGSPRRNDRIIVTQGGIGSGGATIAPGGRGGPSTLPAGRPRVATRRAAGRPAPGRPKR
jgi:murein DD-endopeptidase MepM/ murein hydrolase activator NlpD